MPPGHHFKHSRRISFKACQGRRRGRYYPPSRKSLKTQANALCNQIQLHELPQEEKEEDQEVRVAGKVLAVIGGISLGLLAIAGVRGYYEARLQQERVIGHATGFLEGFALGIQIKESTDKNKRL